MFGVPDYGINFNAGHSVHTDTTITAGHPGTAPPGVPVLRNGPHQVVLVNRIVLPLTGIVHAEYSMQHIGGGAADQESWLSSIAAAVSMAIEGEYARLYTNHPLTLRVHANVNVRFPNASDRRRAGPRTDVWRTVSFKLPYQPADGPMPALHGDLGHELAVYMANDEVASGQIGRWVNQEYEEDMYEFDRLDMFVDFFPTGIMPRLPGGGCMRRSSQLLVTEMSGNWQLTSRDSKFNNCSFVALGQAWNALYPGERREYWRELACYRKLTSTSQGDFVRPDQLALVALSWGAQLLVHYLDDKDSRVLTLSFNHTFSHHTLEVFLYDDHYFNIKAARQVAPKLVKQVAPPEAEAMEVVVAGPLLLDDAAALRRSLAGFQVTLLHGAAGTGKTYQVKAFIADAEAEGRHVVVVASTGVAAFNIGGSTIHSTFCIPVGQKPDANKCVQRLRINHKLDELDVLVVDEVSTMDATLMQLLSDIMRGLFNHTRPFGGKKVLLLGDVCQAPPSNVFDSESPWFFHSGLWKTLCDQHLICHIPYVTNHRNVEPENFDMFQRLRVGKPNAEDCAKLAARVLPPPPNTLHCFFTNLAANNYNSQIFDALPGELVSYQAKLTDVGRKSGVVHLPHFKVFKLGARVMLQINLDVSRGLTNGAMGDISKMQPERIRVDFEMPDGSYVREWIELSDRHHGGLISEMPLMLAYAITINKVEGLTVPRIAVSLNTNGNRGQHQVHHNILYVALTRTQRLCDLYLLPNPRFSDITCDPVCLAAMEDFTTFHYDDRYAELGDESAPLNRMKPTLSVFNGKGGGPAAFKKKLFFDFETWNDDAGKTRIYYGAAKYTVEDKQVGPDIIIHALDDGKSFCDALFAVVMQDCDGHHIPNQDQPIHLLAYNGGRFDMHFILQYIDRHLVEPSRWDVKVIAKGTDIIMLTITDLVRNRIAVKMHDMMHLLSFGSLRDNLKTYNPAATISKGYFPHDAVNRLGPEATFSHSVSISLEEFPEGDRNEVAKLIADGRLDLESYDMKGELDEYCMADVLVLEQLYAAFDAMSVKTLGKSCLQFVSAASMSWFGFLTHLPAQVRLPNTAETRGGALVKKNKNGMIETLIYKSTPEEDAFIRSAVVGGKCGPRVLESHEQPHVLLDMCGMYSSVMRDGDYPYGAPHWGSPDECAVLLQLLQFGGNLPFTIAEVDCALHPMELEPCVGYRLNGATVWDTGRRTQCYSNVALNLIRANAGTFYGVNRMLVWPSSCKLFQEWIIMTETIKAQGKADKSEGLEKLGKNLANNTYGATLKANKCGEVVFINTGEQLENFYLQHELTAVLPRARWDEQQLRLCYGGDRLEAKADVYSQRPAYLGVFVLDYSKAALDRVVAAGNPLRRDPEGAGVRLQPLYGDTDSLLVPTSWLRPLHVAGLLGSTNGLMADDLNKRCYDLYNTTHVLEDARFFYVHHAICPAPKVYSLLYDKGDGAGAIHEKTVAKGVPRRGVRIRIGQMDLGTKISYAHLERAVKSRDSEDPDYLAVRRACGFKRVGIRLTKKHLSKDVGLYEILDVPLERELKLAFKGRKSYDEEEPRFTVPLHYPEKRRRVEFESEEI